MKKVYEKPEIVFESFSLSTNIAGDCGNTNALKSEGDCGIDFGGDTIFLIDIAGCEEEYETDDGTSGVCYYNPTDTTKLFVS